VKVCWLPTWIDADAGDTLILLSTGGAGATRRLKAVVCGIKVPEVPVTTMLAAPVLAELLAVRLSVLVVGEVDVNDATTPGGRPEATRLTVFVNPPVGLIVTVLCTLSP